MADQAIVTVCTRNYLAYARALMLGCRHNHPEVDRFIVLADRPPAGCAIGEVAAEVIYGDQLEIPNWERYSFQYTPFELACALKPHAVRHIMNTRGHSNVVYLDGDTVPYGRLSPLWDALRSSFLVVTAHLLKPLPDDGLTPPESTYLNSGIFNAGVFAIRSCFTGMRFLDWWCSKVQKDSIVNLSRGLFVDQKWLSLAPSIFPGVHILRHFGVNAGHWTFGQAKWNSQATGDTSIANILVNDDPLLLFHFSGMTPDNPHQYLKWQNRLHLDEVPVLSELAQNFRDSVVSQDHYRMRRWGSAFDRLADGTPIHPAWREAIRREEPFFAELRNPFNASASPMFMRRFRKSESRLPLWRSHGKPKRNSSWRKIVALLKRLRHVVAP
jgi:hypothetical protein